MTFKVHIPLGYPNDKDDLIPLRWIEANIQGHDRYYFREINLGMTWIIGRFDSTYHNCFEINFKHKIDMEYFSLVWGEVIKPPY